MTTPQLQPGEGFYTCTMVCALCSRVLGKQKNVLHNRFSGEPVKWSTVKADYKPCPEHPNSGFSVEWSPE
jgi:hypothetical protein